MQVMLKSLDISSARSEVKDILFAIENVRKRLDAGEDVQELDDEVKADIKRLNLSALRVQLLSMSNGDIVLDVS